MKTENLKEYLSIAVDMEKNIYLQKQLRTDLEQEIERLKIPVVIREPVEPDKPIYPTEPSRLGYPMWIIMCVGWLCGAFVVMLFVSGVFFCNMFGMADELQLPFSIVVAVIFSFYKIWKNLITMQRERKTFETQWQKLNEQYQMQLEKHRIELENNERKREQDKTVRETKIFFLQNEKAQVERGLG